MQNYSTGLVFLEYFAGYVLCGLLALFGLVIAWRLLDGTIDLTWLLSEKAGSDDPNSKPIASMSRFQLLVFTFVIAISFFLVVVANVKMLQLRGNAEHLPLIPEVPKGVLGLLGISASSYAVSKAIQQGAGTGGSSSGGDAQNAPRSSSAQAHQ